MITLNKIVIPLDNEYKLVAQQNTDSDFNKEIFIGIETPSGMYSQDLIIVRPEYQIENDKVQFGSERFEMLIFGDETKEDFTDKIVVPLYKEDKNER